MQKNYEATAARGGIPADAPAKRMALITGVVGLENVKDADLVIEAVFETMAIKKEVFTKLDQFAKPGAVLATNTSYLDINAIAAVTKRPQDVLGMHFFSPANVMKLCEIVRAEKTAPDALTTAVAIAKRIAKVPAVVGVCDGFVGNRMLAQRGKQAEKLLFEGALPQQVDAVVTSFGMPMGPFAMGDLAGLDIGWRSRKDRGIKSEIADALCEAGRFGQKTGKGYYKYEAGSRAPLPDPEVEKLIDETLRPARRQAPRRQRRGDPRAHDVSDDQRGRADPRGEDRGAPERHRRDLAVRLRLAGLSRRPDVLRRPGRPEADRRPAVVLRPGDQRRFARAGAAVEAPRRPGRDLCVLGPGGGEGRLIAMAYAGEKYYPDGVRWSTPIPFGTVPGLLDEAVRDYGARPAIEFRDRPISYAGLGALVDAAAAAFLRAGYGRDTSVALFLGNTPDHPVCFFGALKAGARVVHLSPLDGERALSHKLADSGARVLVTSDIAALLPTALKFLDRGLIDRLIVCEDGNWGEVGVAKAPYPVSDAIVTFRSFVKDAAPPLAWPEASIPTTSRCCNTPAGPRGCPRARC